MLRHYKKKKSGILPKLESYFCNPIIEDDCSY